MTPSAHDRGADPVAPELNPDEMAAWHGFLRTHAMVVRRLDEDLQAEHRITLTQYEVLLRLAEAEDGRLRMNELAAGVLLSMSGLTRLVDRLVALGLVERVRCPTDRRGQHAVITAAGRHQLTEARPTVLRGIRRLFLDRLPPGGIDAITSAWRALDTTE